LKRSLKTGRSAARADNELKGMKFSFFPGCSLKASGHENTASLLKFCTRVNIELKELEDWNCCGSSSAHSLDSNLAEQLPMRNISLAPKKIPLLIACPSCFIRMKSMYLKIKNSKPLQLEYQKKWGQAFDESLEIIHFFDIFNRIDLYNFFDKNSVPLKGIRTAPYYGCMLSMPPDLRFETSYHGTMENSLAKLGADIVPFGHAMQCCGTYLSVAKPRLAENVVNKIMTSAIQAGAECMVTACAMCHLNLEIRCTVKKPIPIFHFSELLSMALGADDQKKWFPRHIVDPVPLLEKRKIIS